MEYKKPESFYEIIKEIGRSLYYNFISGEPHTRDGFRDKKNYTKTEWDHRHSYKKISGETKETIDNKL
ncbi:MAG: hypothetical protein KKA61_02580 [Nanoarchaeota archaeon]|nr:hypothetical protein [Nanoarchaeota archaeon]MBU4283833.1 hypothetical protein [Nanoarchaeota archaeon]MBU4493232.1 hypothetical protein [Nanoarchaeota archaeon]